MAEGRYVNWLTDEYMLPSKLQTPRVLLYGYQSLWHSDPVVTHARTIAYRLLERLEEERAVSGLGFLSDKTGADFF